MFNSLTLGTRGVIRSGTGLALGTLGVLDGLYQNALKAIQPAQCDFNGGVPFTLAGINIYDLSLDDTMLGGYNSLLWTPSTFHGTIGVSSHATLNTSPVFGASAMLTSINSFGSGDVEVSYENLNDFQTDPAPSKVVIAGLKIHIDDSNYICVQREDDNSFYGSQLSVILVNGGRTIPAGIRGVSGTTGRLRIAWVGAIVFVYHNDELVYSGNAMPIGNATVQVYVNNNSVIRPLNTTIFDFHSRTGIMFGTAHVVDAQGKAPNRVSGTIPPYASPQTVQLSVWDVNKIHGTIPFNYIDSTSEVVLTQTSSGQLIALRK